MLQPMLALWVMAMKMIASESLSEMDRAFEPAQRVLHKAGHASAFSLRDCDPAVAQFCSQSFVLPVASGNWKNATQSTRAGCDKKRERERESATKREGEREVVLERKGGERVDTSGHRGCVCFVCPFAVWHLCRELQAKLSPRSGANGNAFGLMIASTINCRLNVRRASMNFMNLVCGGCKCWMTAGVRKRATNGVAQNSQRLDAHAHTHTHIHTHVCLCVVWLFSPSPSHTLWSLDQRRVLRDSCSA